MKLVQKQHPADIAGILQRRADRHRRPTFDLLVGQKPGGLEVIDEPSTPTPFGTLVRKRARWLIVLFIGEMLTATAMAHYEEEIASAVVLALVAPLITSSGGNSGSQAASLMIRALAVGFSLVGVVLWGTVRGAMLPFIMKRLGADLATSSAPLVATLVDVAGLVIGFTVAALPLQGDAPVGGARAGACRASSLRDR